MKSRRERRAEARANKVAFEPVYNGEAPKSYEEMHGVGYERFNNKYITIKKVEEVKEDDK